MTTRITIRDWEALSAYLDNQLKPKDRVRLESRLEESPELRTAFDELRRTRGVLRSQKLMRAPRNFTLTPEMAGARTGLRPINNSYPVLRLASVLATIFFFIVTIGDLAVRVAAPAPMTVAVSQDQTVMAPFGMGGGGGGGGAEVPPPPAAPEAQVMEAPAAAAEAPAQAFAPTQPPLAEGEAFSAMASAAPDQKSVEVTPLAPAATPGLAGTPTPAEAAKLIAPGAAEAEEPAQPMQNLAPAEPAQRQSTPPSQPTLEPLLRLIQILLAVLAIGAGLAALYLRRSTRS
jgi:hypothetical protein